LVGVTVGVLVTVGVGVGAAQRPLMGSQTPLLHWLSSPQDVPSLQSEAPQHV
jgi:hypothetical protein